MKDSGGNFDDYYYGENFVSREEETILDQLHKLDFLNDVTYICILIAVIFLIFLVGSCLFSYETCSPCLYSCVRSKRLWTNNLIMFLTAGMGPNLDYRVVRSYCRADGVTLSRNDYRNCLEKFDKLVQELPKSDQQLVDELLNRYKFRKDPHRIIQERERELRKKENKWNKLKKLTATQSKPITDQPKIKENIRRKS
ncbi:uncharacterized protein LOC128388047 [Panonychus citri]|uniref:uncharacterized protein LOC128388047 n=1 Tax=Panonychus citri TaxID=50023 RepID=UPI0023074576|nr:uncharacterized protein LOC128388047 [Panonychus citri]